MRILNITAYTLLALSVPTITFASENKTQSQDLIKKLKQAKQKNQQHFTKKYPEIETDLSIEFSQISTQAKDLQIEENLSALQKNPIVISNFEQSQKQNQENKTDDLLVQNRQPISTTAHQLKQG
ncbi:MAG: hypothetical protein MJK14_17530 [Rivularia sp. ALOHA_DT_140]|nr:hypothetical protein [Rivularia sp. ALOHA_DT_140]